MGRILILDSEIVKKLAVELGADLVGIVKPEPLASEAVDLEKWLNLGYHGEMLWMMKNREFRNDPAKLLPDCKSIVMIGVNYFTPHSHLRTENFPKISRYAWGCDYHEVLRSILKKLADELKALVKENGEPAPKFRIAVDSAPFREKVWAQRAGIGWIGKNSLIITREFGSWIFLGALLTDIGIHPVQAESHPNHCGKCAKCIDSCPTSALRHPGRINANQCLSYLTVEHDGAIPNRFPDRLNGWIFGCDICQNVCPWNRFSKKARLPDFSPRQELLIPDLHFLSTMEEEEFNRITLGTPIHRSGRERLRRNALAVMDLL